MRAASQYTRVRSAPVPLHAAGTAHASRAQANPVGANQIREQDARQTTDLGGSSPLPPVPGQTIGPPL